MRPALLRVRLLVVSRQLGRAWHLWSSSSRTSKPRSRSRAACRPSRRLHPRSSARCFLAEYRFVASRRSRGESAEPVRRALLSSTLGFSACSSGGSFSLRYARRQQDGPSKRGGRPGAHESHVCRCGKAGDAPIHLGSINAAAKEADAGSPCACLVRGTCKLRVGRHRTEAERAQRAIGICDCSTPTSACRNVVFSTASWE